MSSKVAVAMLLFSYSLQFPGALAVESSIELLWHWCPDSFQKQTAASQPHRWVPRHLVHVAAAIGQPVSPPQ